MDETAVELHRLSFLQEMNHTLHHLTQHQHDHLVRAHLVFGHVGCEALQVQRLLRVNFCEILTVGGTLVVLVLTEINHHRNV